MRKFLFLGYFVIIFLFISGCQNSITPFKGALLFADREELLKVDLQTKEKFILLKTNKQNWLLNPSYNKSNKIITIEKCNALDQRCKILLLDHLGTITRTFLDDINPNSFPSWSPDGKLLALQIRDTTVHIDRDVYKVTIFNKQGEKIESLSINSSGGKIAWSSDNRYLSYSSLDEEIIVTNQKLDESIIVGKGRSPIFSPNNSSIAYIADGEIRLFDLKQRTFNTLARNTLLNNFFAIVGWSKERNGIFLLNLAPSFFHEKYFASIYEIKSCKNFRIFDLPAPLSFELI